MPKKRFNILLRTILVLCASGVYISSLVYATDSISRYFPTSSASTLWTSASLISFSTWGNSADGTLSGGTSYYNLNNDTQSVGNYLSGVYYDSNYGYFQLHWDNTTPENNVRVTSVSTKCGVGNYGFDLWGYAKSIDIWGDNNLVGLIKFDYSPDINVYYCDNDKKLHGYAYSEMTWFQSFEWISFEIWAIPDIVNPLTPRNDPYFANNNSVLVTEFTPSFNSVQSDINSTEAGKESLFYIVK
jgi:hypothetical protein